MVPRKGTTTPIDHMGARSPTSAVDTVEARIVAVAEQFGRLLGTVQAKAEGWLDRQTLSDQLTRIRDGAADLLKHLERGTAAASLAAPPAQKPTARPQTKMARTASQATGARGRSGGKVDAPGKIHRTPSASARGVRHSDETVSKTKAAQTTRRGHRRG